MAREKKKAKSSQPSTGTTGPLKIMALGALGAAGMPTSFGSAMGSMMGGSAAPNKGVNVDDGIGAADVNQQGPTPPVIAAPPTATAGYAPPTAESILGPKPGFLQNAWGAFTSRGQAIPGDIYKRQVAQLNSQFAQSAYDNQLREAIARQQMAARLEEERLRQAGSMAEFDRQRELDREKAYREHNLKQAGSMMENAEWDRRRPLTQADAIQKEQETQKAMRDRELAVLARGYSPQALGTLEQQAIAANQLARQKALLEGSMLDTAHGANAFTNMKYAEMDKPEIDNLRNSYVTLGPGDFGRNLQSGIGTWNKPPQQFQSISSFGPIDMTSEGRVATIQPKAAPAPAPSLLGGGGPPVEVYNPNPAMNNIPAADAPDWLKIIKLAFPYFNYRNP